MCFSLVFLKCNWVNLVQELWAHTLTGVRQITDRNTAGPPMMALPSVSFCYHVDEVQELNCCLCKFPHGKTVSLFTISLKVAVAKHLSAALSEDPQPWWNEWLCPFRGASFYVGPLYGVVMPTATKGTDFSKKSLNSFLCDIIYFLKNDIVQAKA